MLQSSNILSAKIYYRIIAIWILCECLLGGILHSFKLPITGIFVGGSVSICIVLIAHYYPKRGSIIRAAIAVALFKLMLSPTATPMSYFAMFFQAIAGEIIFSSDRNVFKMASFLFILVTMLESALQRVLVIIIVWKTPSLDAMNKFIKEVSHETYVSNYAIWYLAAFVCIHIIIGILLGWFCAKLPFKIEKTQTQKTLIENINSKNIIAATKAKNKILPIAIWLILCVLLIQPFVFPNNPIIREDGVLHLIIRFAVALLTWSIIINPVLLNAAEKKSFQSASKFESALQQIALLFPSINYIFKQSWTKAASQKESNRINAFYKIAVANLFRQ
jgi:hypothetical protein